MNEWTAWVPIVVLALVVLALAFAVVRLRRQVRSLATEVAAGAEATPRFKAEVLEALAAVTPAPAGVPGDEATYVVTAIAEPEPSPSPSAGSRDRSSPTWCCASPWSRASRWSTACGARSRPRPATGSASRCARRSSGRASSAASTCGPRAGTWPTSSVTRTPHERVPPVSRSLWFAAGAGAGVYVMVRARRVAEAVSLDGLKDRANAAVVGAAGPARGGRRGRGREGNRVAGAAPPRASWT